METKLQANGQHLQAVSTFPGKGISIQEQMKSILGRKLEQQQIIQKEVQTNIGCDISKKFPHHIAQNISPNVMSSTALSTSTKSTQNIVFTSSASGSKKGKQNKESKRKQSKSIMSSKMLPTAFHKIRNSDVSTYSEIYLSSLTNNIENNFKEMNGKPKSINKDPNNFQLTPLSNTDINSTKKTTKDRSPPKLIVEDKQKTSIPNGKSECNSINNLVISQTNSNNSLEKSLKQESLLRNNCSDNLTSPRSKLRSQSLNSLDERQESNGRKLSISSDGILKQNTMETIYIIDDDDDDDEDDYNDDSGDEDHNDVDDNKTMKSSETKISSSKYGNQNNSTNNNNINGKTSLLCDENIEMLACSGSSNSSNNSRSLSQTGIVSNPSKLSTVLDMMSIFNMITWKERLGFIEETQIKFQLNEFNLLEVHELCPRGDQLHTAYEKPIHDRSFTAKDIDSNYPVYLCRRCNCHGRSSDFLAPEFCSLECVKIDTRKRRNYLNTSTEKLLCLSNIGLLNPKKEKHNQYLMPSIKTEQSFMHANDYITKAKHFHWANYLRLPNGERYEAANIDKFLNPFPCGPNLFLVGMKLEAIDPENASLFCICTVVEKKGYRLRLNFDGYNAMHDIWVNADSMDIFPPGWCAKTNRVLQPPKYMSLLTFNWPAYLAKTKAITAPRNLFTHLNTSSNNPFKIGMRLEAVDIKNSKKLCVASVADVLNNRILVHFDGWDKRYDYWAEINSPFIHPIEWHLRHNQELIVPPDWTRSTEFTWPLYLSATHSLPALDSMFLSRDAMNFPLDVKLEVVDKKNPALIRPATIVQSRGHRIKVHWDGWKSEYSYWMTDDSPDIHPVGWCDFTGHELEPPPGYGNLPVKMLCPIKGCRGIGNFKRSDIDLHNTKDCCPYELSNWLSERKKPSRLHDDMRKIKLSSRNIPCQQEKLEKENFESFSKRCKKEPAPDSSSMITCKSEILDNDEIIISDYVVPDEVIEIPPIQSPIAIQRINSISEEHDEVPNILAKEFLCDYGPRLRQNYAIWRSNNAFIPKDIKTNPLTWTTSETAAFIENTIHCRQTTEIFREEDIDGIALLSMRQSDLTDILNLKLGISVKLFSLILHLRDMVVTKFTHVNIKTEKE